MEFKLTKEKIWWTKNIVNEDDENDPRNTHEKHEVNDIKILNTDMCADEFKKTIKSLNFIVNVREKGRLFKKYYITIDEPYRDYEYDIYNYREFARNSPMGETNYYFPKYTFIFESNRPDDSVSKVLEYVKVQRDCGGVWKNTCWTDTVEKVIYDRRIK